MSMTPFALALLGVESVQRRERSDDGDAVRTSPTQRPAPPRRATSYYNQFQTVCNPTNDEPPPYAIAAKRPVAHNSRARDVLPRYDCTVTAQAKLLVNLESVNPLHAVTENEWREVYVVLRGTLISFHRPKDNGPGRLLRTYTLQHAEIGLATDADHAVLVPQTRLANLIPSGARRRAWQKYPSLFRPVRQHVLRLRAETDQILLADASEERIHSFIQSISAGIDISCALDERNLPRQCTVPRRRRRPRPANPSDLNDPALLAEQERILRDMYPAFAGPVAAARPQGETQMTPTTDPSPAEAPPTPTREEDELDLSIIREDAVSSSPNPSSTTTLQRQDSAQRPSPSNTAPSSPTNLTFAADMMHATSPNNFCSLTGKWQPPHNRTHHQIQRYTRRCMPILLADAVRASDIIICNGKRVKINWRMELLEEWELRPPSYKSHGFENDSSADHAGSIAGTSTAASASQPLPQAASTSVLGAESDDQITPMEEVSLATLQLSLTKTVSADTKPLHAATSTATQGQAKTIAMNTADIHGAVFCF